MKTTKQIFDEFKEEFYLNEQAYLQARREIEEQNLMQELFEEEMANRKATIVLGEKTKAGRFATHARIFIRKRPRFLKSRTNDRKVPRSS